MPILSVQRVEPLDEAGGTRLYSSLAGRARNLDLEYLALSSGFLETTGLRGFSFDADSLTGILVTPVTEP